MSDQVTYTAGSACTVSLDLIDETGLAVEGTGYTWNLYDEEGTELGTGTGTLGAGDAAVSVTISAALNTLPADTRLGARLLSVIVNTASGDTHRLETAYLLRGQVFLSVPRESGQSVLQAMILAQGMSGALMQEWNYADQSDREGALMEAWARLSRLAYSPWRFDENPDPTLPDLVKRGEFAINDLSNTDWNLLPGHFRTALRRAQIIEAAVLLGGDPIWERRQDGLLSKSVGESSEMFRTRPPVQSAVSPKARREIASYLETSVRIGRA